MEQVIAPRLAQERILEAEYRQAPAWTQFETNPNAAEIGRREKVAWKLVDRIVCGSQFVSDEIAAEGGPADKCVVVPYGVRTSEFRAASPRPVREALPLRVLFVGSVGLRKGVPYLLEAARRLGPDKVRCRLVGGFSAPADVLQREAPANVELVGSVPRSQIAREYANADVFCLPSLCEGSATVIYEALAAGLPVLTTPNAGSIVRDGVEGYIVPIRNAEAIADRLAHLASDPARLKEMSRAAAERSEYGSLVSYGRRLLGVLREMN
jgi:glycosyltransferase involved in cell wall biosynthesis